jgi:hypothetical protein
MFFKVKIQGQDPTTRQDVPNLKVISAPIKVISKPEQIKKPPRNVSANPVIPANPIPPQAIAPMNPNIVNKNGKRSVNDLVVDAVTRIEKTQYDHTNALERILQFVALPKQENSLNPNASWEFLPPLNKIPRKGTAHLPLLSALVLTYFITIRRLLRDMLLSAP